MARVRGNGPTRPTGDRSGAAGRGQDGRDRGSNGAPPARISLRCPNPDCEKRYSVPARYAGRRAKCAECGAETVIPPATPPTAKSRQPGTRHRGDERLPAAREKATPRSETLPGVPEIRVGCIGRGHAGKTALFVALGESLVGDFLPSGLHLDAADPREVARMIREADEARRQLQRTGLPPTTEPSHVRYCLYDGDEPRVVCRMREVVGQVLTHTLPDSDPRLQAKYARYIRSLANANVLWAVVPCPPADPGPRDRRRYANDLRIILAYLREALRLRTAREPAAVALVLTKTDALFPDAASARAALTDDVLRRALGPLVNLIESSAHVSDAAVFPVTAFGYGKAVLRDQGTDRAGAPGSADEPFGDEPIWLLREGEAPEPHNLDALLLWSILLGLLNRGGTGPTADAIGRVWRDDLEGGHPWLVPIKGGVALAE
jgi:hypothetical protein